MDSLLNQETDIVEWLNILIRNPDTAEQDLSSLSIKLQLIEQDIELNLDYLSYGIHSTMESLKCEVDSISRQTQDLLIETQQVSKTLTSIYTPEITQLQQEHSRLSLITSSKQTLEEIQLLDSKLSKALECAKHNSPESISLIKDLHSTLKRIQDVPSYSSYKDQILSVVEAYDQTLTELCFTACKESNMNSLKRLKSGFESFENLSKFNEIVYACRLEALPSQIFENSVEGLEDLAQRLKTEFRFFEEILADFQTVVSSFVVSYLNKIRFLKGFDLIDPQRSVLVFEAFLEFAKVIKENLGSVECLKDFFAVFVNRGKAEEEYLKAKQMIFERPVSLRSWAEESRRVVEELQDGWNRSILISFGTCGYEWSNMAEEIIQTQFKLLNSNYSEITNISTDSIPDTPDNKLKFQWSNCNKFIQVFEETLQIYTLIEDLSVKCRTSFLQNMTTTYFTPQMEINKEIQSYLLAAFPNLSKNNTSFISFLREGGVFFAKSLEGVEKELEICKGFIEKILLSAINQEIQTYSDQDLFKAPETIFNVSPSPVILKCGEHILEVLQLLTPKNEEIYLKAFLILYATRPPKDLPHSASLHFWVLAFVSRFLKMIMIKIQKIQGITAQGRKQLIADVEYLYNITSTLGLLRQDDLAFGRNLILLRQKLNSGQEV